MFEVLLQFWPIIITFLIVAILYSSVGFGGGSSYLAVLALTSFAFTEIRYIALLCNIIVVSNNCILFIRQKNFDLKKLFPLVVLSIPMAFLGGFVKINQQFFYIFLGLALLFAALLMWFSKKINEKTVRYNKKQNLFFGGAIGFLSGMVGIGGGIFLAPLLHLSKWDSPKKIAVASSFFILVNSIAGFIGQQISFDTNLNWKLIITLLVAVFIGGQIGNRFSNSFFTANQLKRATAILVAIVSLRILYKYLL
jgi:uncharacterized membrane protein YfcA